MKLERSSRVMSSCSAKVASGPKKPMARNTRSASKSCTVPGICRHVCVCLCVCVCVCVCVCGSHSSWCAHATRAFNYLPGEREAESELASHVIHCFAAHALLAGLNWPAHALAWPGLDWTGSWVAWTDRSCAVGWPVLASGNLHQLRT